MYANSVFDKLKQYIRSSRNNILELCRQYDTSRIGKITNLEFRNVIKKLNLGLTTIEINQLFDFINVNSDGSVNYESFVNRL